MPGISVGITQLERAQTSRNIQRIQNILRVYTRRRQLVGLERKKKRFRGEKSLGKFQIFIFRAVRVLKYLTSTSGYRQYIHTGKKY